MRAGTSTTMRSSNKTHLDSLLVVSTQIAKTSPSTTSKLITLWLESSSIEFKSSQKDKIVLLISRKKRHRINKIISLCKILSILIKLRVLQRLEERLMLPLVTLWMTRSMSFSRTVRINRSFKVVKAQ
jgi:hypothetical protein